ncbi:MAG: peptide chain release factor N(5)-glutamine methyltransferase, partial [Pseudomonadota bacterium]
MTTLTRLLADLTARLGGRLDHQAARREARLLVAHATGLDRLRQAADPAAPIPPEACAQALDLAERRARGAPLAYLLGQREFFGLEFAVGPGVLVPRPDSEVLVEAALAHLPPDRPARIVDLGTGSGCLLLAVLAERPLAYGLGVDRSAAALGYARLNAHRLGLADRAGFVQGDWWQALGGRFDVVLANPPYIRSAEIDGLMPEVRDHEPREALDGGSDGLADYRRLLAGLPDHLADGGCALFEIGYDQGADLLALARAAGFCRVRLLP